MRASLACQVAVVGAVPEASGPDGDRTEIVASSTWRQALAGMPKMN